MYKPGEDRKLAGVEAVIDKDLCSELLARELDADLLIMATDASAVFTEFGTPDQKAIHRASPEAIQQYKFPAGSMGPKVDAACQFARTTGREAAIGALHDLPEIVNGNKGTIVSGTLKGLTWHS
jgi:carbamate kinase